MLRKACGGIGAMLILTSVGITGSYEDAVTAKAHCSEQKNKCYASYPKAKAIYEDAGEWYTKASNDYAAKKYKMSGTQRQWCDSKLGEASTKRQNCSSHITSGLVRDTDGAEAEAAGLECWNDNPPDYASAAGYYNLAAFLYGSANSWYETAWEAGDLSCTRSAEVVNFCAGIP